MHTALDYANYIETISRDRKISVSHTQLQSLLYILQAYSLSKGSSLFPDTFITGSFYPVIHEIRSRYPRFSIIHDFECDGQITSFINECLDHKLELEDIVKTKLTGWKDVYKNEVSEGLEINNKLIKKDSRKLKNKNLF